ncbi:SHC-transforming protein 4 [Diorhabda sublineata]|uniref:SHC-transforming protein 4 n=1 Tax=Diorhabda sublineata TaxID=1163346 RepID=UPI0024E1658F|nr:SHC-transforming protein 4 [Diorhabda sublineata]
MVYNVNHYIVKMSAFNIKPSSGWIHPDKLIANEGATYAVKYVGCLEVKVSMKKLNFKMRSSVAKECINRVCEYSKLKNLDKKRIVDKKVLKAIAEVPDLRYTGSLVNLNVSSIYLTLTSLENNQILTCHEMPRISFACGGDTDTLDFIGYIAKDTDEMRACYVLECAGGLAKDVISTIGQAFELRFQQFTLKAPLSLGATMGRLSPSTGGDADKDYYNDLPGKVPPDVCEPPPVPPLPSLVPPFTTLPPVQTSNLIDLNADVTPEGCHHYVNDSVMVTRERDVFDMQPFTPSSIYEKTVDPIGQLESEIWFHGQISRIEAENLLQKDGDFLVRESTNTLERQFVLSGMQDNNKKHLLLIDPQGVVRTKDRIFKSICHLIEFHCENALPIISAESALVLRHKVPRAS